MKFGQKNITFGWVWLLVGLICGAVIGMWSFNGPFPSPLGDYTALPRRMVRLVHIAFVALSFLNILYGHEIDKVKLSGKFRKVGCQSLMFGSIFMPTLLIISAFFEPVKYLLAIPATLVILGISIMVIGRLRK